MDGPGYKHMDGPDYKHIIFASRTESEGVNIIVLDIVAKDYTSYLRYVNYLVGSFECEHRRTHHLERLIVRRLTIFNNPGKGVVYGGANANIPLPSLTGRYNRIEIKNILYQLVYIDKYLGCPEDSKPIFVNGDVVPCWWNRRKVPFKPFSRRDKVANKDLLELICRCYHFYNKVDRLSQYLSRLWEKLVRAGEIPKQKGFLHLNREMMLDFYERSPSWAPWCVD